MCFVWKWWNSSEKILLNMFCEFSALTMFTFRKHCDTTLTIFNNISCVFFSLSQKQHQNVAYICIYNLRLFRERERERAETRRERFQFLQPYNSRGFTFLLFSCMAILKRWLDTRPLRMCVYVYAMFTINNIMSAVLFTFVCVLVCLRAFFFSLFYFNTDATGSFNAKHDNEYYSFLIVLSIRKRIAKLGWHMS